MSDKVSTAVEDGKVIDGVAVEVKPPEVAPVEVKTPTEGKPKPKLAVQVVEISKASENALSKISEEASTTVAFDKLDEDDQQKALVMASKFNPSASADAIVSFGAGPMQELADKSNDILEKTQMRDLVQANEVVEKFVVDVDRMDLDSPLKPAAGIQKVFTFFDPIKKFFRGLEKVTNNLNRLELKIGDSSNNMLERANWFRGMAEELKKKSPVLFLLAAAGEKIVEREALILDYYNAIFQDPDAFREQVSVMAERAAKDSNDLEAQAKLVLMRRTVEVYDQNPNGFDIVLREQQHIVDRMRGKVMDLHSNALFCVYMQPVMKMSEDAAMTAYDTCKEILIATMPEIRTALSAIIAMNDVQSTQKGANEVRRVGARMIGKVAESLGRTNESIISAYDVRRENAEEIRKHVMAIATQMREYLGIHEKVGQIYVSTLQSFSGLDEMIKKAALGQGGENDAGIAYQPKLLQK